MLTEQDLLIREFHRYKPAPEKMAAALYSKWISSESGVRLYALHCYVYDFSNIPNHPYPSIQYSFEAAMYPPEYDRDGTSPPWFMTSLHGCHDLIFAETFFATIFNRMACQPDPHNQ